MDQEERSGFQGTRSEEGAQTVRTSRRINVSVHKRGRSDVAPSWRQTAHMGLTRDIKQGGGIDSPNEETAQQHLDLIPQDPHQTLSSLSMDG